MESIWKSDLVAPEYQTLNGNKTTDVLIVGGGIAGILCAYKLKNAGIKCTLVEADKICAGVSAFTTAKITAQHGLIYSKLLKMHGKEKAKLYLDAQLHAGEQYEKLCQDIDCDYQIKDSYVYSLNNRRKIIDEISALRRLGIKADYSDAKELPFEVAGAIVFKNQAQFNPLKFLYRISENLTIYENTKVTQFKDDKVITNHGSIVFNKLIIATHFPIFNKHGAYFIKMYQHRSYVLALKGISQMRGMYADESDTGLSFRSYKDMLLLGGGGHRTGKSGGAWFELEEVARKYFGGAKIAHSFATQDCITLDRVPYIGRYCKTTPNVFVTTGFNKWGMTNAMVGADIICDMIRGRENKFADIFSPSRSVIGTQLIKNSFESVIGLITPTVPRCPHLGCALKYNSAEHTWDCPCHGSRFSHSGKLINNPATDDHKSIGK